MSRVDPKRLSLHAGTLRPVGRFEEKAELAARAGFGAWALRGVELEAYLAGGRTIDDVRRLNEKHGLTISETGSLMQWQFTGGVPLLNTFQRPPGASDDELRSGADRLARVDPCARVRPGRGRVAFASGASHLPSGLRS